MVEWWPSSPVVDGGGHRITDSLSAVTWCGMVKWATRSMVVVGARRRSWMVVGARHLPASGGGDRGCSFITVHR